jgi:hypothetical protein
MYSLLYKSSSKTCTGVTGEGGGNAMGEDGEETGRGDDRGEKLWRLVGWEIMSRRQ